MSCRACRGTCCPGNRGFLVVLLVLLGVSLLSGLARLIGRLDTVVSLPSAAWIPLSGVAIAGTVGGLWLGFKQHGRGEPLAVGLFGLLVAVVGFLVAYPVAVLGVAIVLAAALWSAFTYAELR